MYYKVNFKPDVVIYHDPCMDGFTSAYAVWVRYKEEAQTIQFIPGNHSKGKQDVEYWNNLVKDKKVVILDYSFDREPLLKMHEIASELVVLDHHKSAEESLGDLDFCHFRQDMSGALISWHAFHEGGEVPKLFQYVSDRDLWRWKLPYSREINAYIRAQKKTFEDWHSLCLYLDSEEVFTVAAYGNCMVQCVNALVDTIASKSEIWWVNDVKVVAVNSSELQSEVCSLLLKHEEGEGVSGCYSIDKGKVTWSLRSVGEIDVSKIAETLGGGGHLKAAGFTLSLEDGQKQINFMSKRITSG